MNNLESRIEALKAIATSTDSKAINKIMAIKELNAIYGYNTPAKHEITNNSVSASDRNREG